MAIHKLDGKEYLQLDFNPSLWEGINTNNLLELVNNLVPPITKITTLSENDTLEWLWGRVQILGKGRVSVMYPYVEEHTEDFQLKNVDLSTYPFVTLIADQGDFQGWFDSCTEELLSDREMLVLASGKFEKVTGFQARFA